MTTFRPTPRMRQVTSLDAHFIAVEDGKVHGHVSALAIYDPSTSPGGLSLDVVRDLVAERVRLLAPFRWRLAEVPFGLDHLCWFEDPNLDLVYHIRQLALPADGNEQLFAEQVARLIARSLDRARPLWELHLIHALGPDSGTPANGHRHKRRRERRGGRSTPSRRSRRAAAGSA